jgi:transposase-like protein
MREVSKEVVEALLEGELTDHLGFEKHDQKTKATDNTRNGYTPKTVKSKFGEIDLDVPRDRKSDFEPQVVKKRQKDISGLEEKIISMYAKGMTTRDIQAHIKDLYGYEISPETVSSITDKVMERAREWQGRQLAPPRMESSGCAELFLFLENDPFDTSAGGQFNLQAIRYIP